MSALSFMDEAAHVLGGKMLNAGGTLYGTFVDSHGPLIFMLMQAYGAVFGWTHPNGSRAMVMFAAVLALVSVAVSPGFLQRRERLWATALFAGLLASVWLVQGLYQINFYGLGGALACICLAGFLAGVWRGRVSSRGAFAAGVALALLGAAAYSYLPSAALFALSGAIGAWRERRRDAVVWFVAGGVAGAVGMLLYLVIYGDVLGYLAFHFAESQFIYARYIGFSTKQFFGSFLLSASAGAFVQDLSVVCLASGLAILLWLDRPGTAERVRHAGEILLGFCGVALLNARGLAGFQNGAFVIACLAMGALAAARLLGVMHILPAWARTAFVFSMPLTAMFVLRFAIYTPFNLDRAGMQSWYPWPIQRPVASPLFDRVRAAVRPDERILALVFQPGFYLAVDRLPIDGFYAYFKWDADYAAHPWFGRQRDLCVALAASPPPVIAYDGYPVWGYDPHQYMACVFDLIQKHYVHDPDFNEIFIRRDRYVPRIPR